jgi:hypothetical protein
MRRRLVSARQSLSFRIGRATRVAVRESGKGPVPVVRRWLDTFRGQDEILVELAQAEPARAPVRIEASEAELRAIARQHFLAGLPALDGPRPGIAGVAGSALAAELGAAARFRRLGPDDWQHLLEAEPPAFVLLTSDGLAPGTAWGDYGVPGGRSGVERARELVEWCRGRRLPVAWWDTLGLERPRLGAPRGARFDAVFSVSASLANGQVRPLGPAVEPLVQNPIGVVPGPARHPIFAGGFDGRRGGGALLALLRAAAPRGLVILDDHWRYQGALAEAVRFPEDLQPLCRQRPPLAGELRAVREAGLLLADTPWSVLRGVALGAHVVSVAEVADPALGEHVLIGPDALDRAAARSVLDAPWRRAFERVLAAHSLRDRLDEIGRACGTGRVSTPAPSIAVIARVRVAAELDALRQFLAAQTAAPAEVRVAFDGGLDPRARLADAIEPARLAVAPAADARAARFLGGAEASHLLCWRPGAPAPRDAIAELTICARLSDADLLALAAGGDGPIWRHGDAGPDALLAVRREALVPQLGAAADADPAALVRALEVEGARRFSERVAPGTRGSEKRLGVV